MRRKRYAGLGLFIIGASVGIVVSILIPDPLIILALALLTGVIGILLCK